VNLVELQSKLISVARANAPDGRVPFAFEKRIVVLLGARRADDGATLWARGLWQAAASCAVIALLCGAWAFLSPADDDMSQNFETTLLASVDQGDQAQ